MQREEINMAFNIDTYDMPRIQDYKHARKIFNAIPTVRGENKSVKRLGNRKAKHKWLKLEIIDGMEVYKAGLYNDVLISYYPTHLEMSLGGWYSRSTCKFIEHVGRISLWNFSYKHYIPKGYSIDIGVENSVCYANGHLINSRDVYRFDYNGNPMDLDRHPTPKKYRVNRKSIKAIRDEFQPFYQYVKTMFNLMAVDGKLKGDFLDGYKANNNLMADIDDKDKWFEAFEYLANRASSYEWHVNGHVKVVNRYYDMLDYVESAIRINNPQVLEIVI